VRQLALAKRRFRSETATPISGWRGSYAPESVTADVGYRGTSGSILLKKAFSSIAVYLN
jgi:hypothetical protein